MVYKTKTANSAVTKSETATGNTECVVLNHLGYRQSDMPLFSHLALEMKWKSMNVHLHITLAVTPTLCLEIQEASIGDEREHGACNEGSSMPERSQRKMSNVLSQF